MSFVRNAPLARRVILPLVVSLLAATAIGCSNQSSRSVTPNATDSAGTIARVRSVRLSADAQGDAILTRCLANPQGVVARYTDNEAYIAVDPKNPDRVIAVWQTLSGSGAALQFATSTDGGTTWTQPSVAPTNECAGGPVPGAKRTSDPWATFGPDGRAYVSAIAWTPNPNDGPDPVSGLVVVASPDGGITWEPPVAAAVAPSTNIAHDNLAITADPTRPRTVYAATTREERNGTEYYGPLGFTRSDDGGKTWTPIRPISPTVNNERIGAPQILVDPHSGKLYAVYRRSRRGSNPVVGVMWSNDRGDTWSNESVAAPHVRGAQAIHPATAREFVLATDIVQATVSPTGRLVIAYADARRNPGGRSDVSIVWSPDGATWSQPIAVSDSSGDAAWLPAIAAGTNREVGVAYFSANFTAGATPRARVMLRRFREGPAGYTPIDRVQIDEAALDWPGDYHALVPVRGGFVAAYGRENDIVATKVAARP